MPPPDDKKLTQAYDFCVKSMFGVEAISKSKDRFEFRGAVWNSDDNTYSNTFSIGIDSTSYGIDDMRKPNGGGAAGFNVFRRGQTGIYSFQATYFGKTGTFQSNTVFVANDTGRINERFTNRFERRGIGLTAREIVTYHEVGNALATITGKDHLPDNYVDPITGKQDPEAYKEEQHAGQAFENCIFKNYRNLLGGRGLDANAR